MNNNENKILTARGIAEIAIMTAIALSLDFLQSGLWKGFFVNGGSIGLSMIPLLILCYRRGFVAGLISGFILSFLQMLGGVYAIASTWYNVFFQILLDYILAYPLVALAGLFYKKFHESDDFTDKIKWAMIGTFVGGSAKFLAHFLAGFIFWSSSVPETFEGGPLLYSFLYNGGYMLPNIIISGLIISIIIIKAPKIFEVEEIKHKKVQATTRGDTYEE